MFPRKKFMTQIETKAKLRIKAYSMKEVANMYEVSGRTMRRWLTPFRTEIGQRRGRYFNPKQIRIIFDKLGIPELTV
jgi:transposase